MEPVRQRWGRRVRRFLVALAAWGAVALDFNGDPTAYFNYFTIITNMAIGAWFLVASFAGQWAEARSGLRLSLTIYGLVTATVYWVLLAPTFHLEGLRVLATVVLHLVVPLAMVAEDVLIPWPPVGPRGPFVIIVFPLAYLVGAFVRGQLTGWYPYFFLDQSKMGGWAMVTLFLVGMFAVFLVLASVWSALVGRLYARKIRKATAS